MKYKIWSLILSLELSVLRALAQMVNLESKLKKTYGKVYGLFLILNFLFIPAALRGFYQAHGESSVLPLQVKLQHKAQK